MLNGIDAEELAPESRRREQTRAAMGAAGHFIWMTAGRMVPAKDYPNLLRAFARVREAHPEARLWIAGEAAGQGAAAIEALTSDLGLDGSVFWLGLRRDIPALLDGADGFVLGSAWEGMPLALGEAMAMEKPIVATDVGGVPELAGEIGQIVPSGNPAALAKAMIGITEMPVKGRETMGRAARQRILASFSLDKRADEWDALYSALLNRA